MDDRAHIQYIVADERASTFNPYDWNLFYFGTISRDGAEQVLLQPGMPYGTFLIRDSSTSPGDYVLCVLLKKISVKTTRWTVCWLDFRAQIQIDMHLHSFVKLSTEASKDGERRTSHYLMSKTRQESGTEKWMIGVKQFADIAEILNYYSTHTLETTHLVQPAPRQQSHTCIALYDFSGQDSSDLPFKKDEILWILNKSDGEDWWTARNELGRSGQIPSTHVKIITDSIESELSPTDETSSGTDESVDRNSAISNRLSGGPVDESELRKLPAMARVIRERIPCAYWKDHLRLKVGDIIKVTKADDSGMFEGDLNGKSGKFPFTYIEWVH